MWRIGGYSVVMANRINVALIARSVAALDQLTARGLSVTDVTNRAIQLYAFVEEQRAAGAVLKLHQPGGDVERVTLI
jgi:hypothetical protein